MGMGYGAGYADVVSETFVKKHAPTEFKAWKKTLDKFEIDLEDFAKAIEYDDQNYYLENLEEENQDKAEKALPQAWKKLQDAFHIKTGLTLFLGFHDSDNEGDHYDDINGTYWCVSGVWTLTKAGKKYSLSVDRKFFVTFG